ncbi:MAG TPA: ABC transporter permease [Streptosporangiaceae bacterium]|jgi:ABC-2 type transport system permease protein
MRILRVVMLAWWLHVKMMSRSAFESVLQVVWPLFFATTALLMYRLVGDADALLYPALGASVMAIWTAISTMASGILQRERGYGTLELLVAAPSPFSTVIFPITLAVSTVGLYGMIATLVWARLLFGVDTGITRSPLTVVAVMATVIAIGALGFVMSVTVVRYRAAWALGNVLEYPVWLICGFLVPVSLLPGWVQVISWLLAPTWGVRAIREASAGGTPLPELATCIGLAVAYGVMGIWLGRKFVHAARQHATLSLT